MGRYLHSPGSVVLKPFDVFKCVIVRWLLTNNPRSWNQHDMCSSDNSTIVFQRLCVKRCTVNSQFCFSIWICFCALKQIQHGIQHIAIIVFLNKSCRSKQAPAWTLEISGGKPTRINMAHSIWCRFEVLANRAWLRNARAQIQDAPKIATCKEMLQNEESTIQSTMRKCKCQKDLWDSQRTTCSRSGVGKTFPKHYSCISVLQRSHFPVQCSVRH